LRGWLLDTNVVSELRKPNANPAVVSFIDAQRGETLFITDITFAEIVYGIEQLGDPARRADLRSWLETSLRPFFHGRVLGITEQVIIRWKTMVIDGRKRGHTFGQPDLFIAAIAALQDMAVVTRDVSEFVEAGVPTFDPWTSTLHLRDKKASVAPPVTLEKIDGLL
jgi:predicted nucleic acid-binding protein